MTATGSSSVGTAVHNGSFDNLDFGVNGAQWRLVACGFRVRYSGTVLNQSGRIATIEHPNHLTWVSENMEGLLQYDNATPRDFDRKWHSVTYQPIYPDEMTYTQNTGVPGPASSNYFLAAAFNGSPGQSYSIEWVQHAEYVGHIARGKSPNVSDTSATQQIISKIGSVASHIVSSAADHIAANPSQTVNVIRTLLTMKQGPSQRVLANHAFQHTEL
jgi:hypothetical protein